VICRLQTPMAGEVGRTKRLVMQVNGVFAQKSDRISKITTAR
jgi:hypothetical protein